MVSGKEFLIFHSIVKMALFSNQSEFRKNSIAFWHSFIIFFCFQLIEATQYEPWLGNLYEFEFRNKLYFQDYQSISSGACSLKQSASDLFLNASLANSLEEFSLELEIRAARTRKQKGKIDQFKGTLRYCWLDDIVGDSISLITGLSLTQAFKHSVNDYSSFHHSRGEGELFISIGKEFSLESGWCSRWWSTVALGSGETGSPWFRFNLTYEKCIEKRHELGAFMHSLWGFGSEKLNLKHFHGYGPIQHAAFDVGLRYTYLMEFFGTISLEYAHRFYARNFPLHTNCVTMQFFYPFGL